MFRELTGAELLNIEIIAIDDSSSDRTREIILEYSKLARSRTKIILVDAQETF